MKKFISLLLLACMIFTLAACGAKTEAPAQTPAEAPAETPAEAPAETPVEEVPAELEYTLGMGVALNTDSSKENNAQVDATFAAVVLDAEGKIVVCRLDCAQSKMDITGGAVDAAKTFLTKMELGDDYNMVKFGGAIAEWYDQAKAFEEYVVGMTGTEVAALELQEHNGHMISVDEALLAGCTMDITDFMAAIEKACSDAWAVKFSTADAFTLGVAAITEAADSVAATAEENGSVNMYSYFGAAVVGADGKVLAALNDASQPKIAIDVNGGIVEAVFNGTKRELGENYNMVKFGAAIAEWDAQSAAFSAYVTGKTAAEITALETQEHNGHQITVDETLLASCTMDITSMRDVIAQAANYAR